MARIRSKRLKEEYGISPKRYKELCGFCEQYPEWIAELKQLQTTVKSPSLSGMPHGNGTSSAVESLAIRRVMISEKIKLVEDTAKEVSSDYWQYLIKSACYGVTFALMRDFDRIPFSKHGFSEMRRKFFYLLSLKR